MSPSYFSTIFKQSTRLTFTDFITRTRVKAAQKQLLAPHRRVSEIAYAIGFHSTSQFNRSFKKITSESPTEYRERFGNGRQFHP